MLERRRWQRSAGRAAVVVGALAALAALAPLPDASGQAPATGFAHASARSLAIDPRTGGLSFGVSFGNATADQENAVARSRAKAVALGLVGAALGAEACDGGASPYPMEAQPQAILADSRAEDAGQWRTEDGGIVYHEVRASPQPLAEANTEVEGFALPGVLEIGSAVTSSSAGTGEDGLRFARAEASIGEVQIGGGVVVLRGLRWFVEQRDQADPPTVAGFELGGIELAGVPLPAPDPDAGVGLANALLGPLGIELRLPFVRPVDDGAFVEPLAVAIVPNELRDGIVAEALGALAPVRRLAFDQILLQDPCNEAYVLVFDLLVGSVTGAGAFELNLGGVEATSRPAAARADLGGVGTPTAPAPAPAAPPPAAPVDRTAPPPPPAVAAPAPVATPLAAPAALPAAVPAAATFVRRDFAAAIALSTLLLGALLVELDRRRMRAALAP